MPYSRYAPNLVAPGTPSVTSQISSGSSPATRVATWDQRLSAMRIAIVLSILTILLLPYARTGWPAVPAFLPAYQGVLIVTYLVTAYLIHMQFQATRTLSLLYLSATCVYTAGVLTAQFLSFPNAFEPNVQLLGGPQSTIWLWAYWHVGPALGILLYAWAEYRHPGRLSENVARSTAQTVVVLCLLLGATLASVTLFASLLPVMDVGGDYTRADTLGVAPVIQLALAVGLFVLWKGSRFRTVLNLWLGIALFALFCDNALTMMGGTRLSLGWYLGRINALVSAMAMMYVYLREIKRSYVRTAEVAQALYRSNTELAVRVDEARIDTLTKLPMRDLLLERAEVMRTAAIARAQGFATLFIDLDGFKGINDRFGHDHGDIVLIRTATAIQALLNESDLAGRIGGDEFVVCMAAPLEDILPLATKLSERIVDKIGKLGDGIGASVGISVSNASLDAALREADEAMYESKKTGRNRASLYRPKPQLVSV
jgi:diguanylate cyclase (GGDEF)-like protein